MVRKRKYNLFALFVCSFVLFATACGDETMEQSSQSSSVSETATESSSSIQMQDIVKVDGTIDIDLYNRIVGVDLEEVNASEEEIPEDVIVVGARTKDYLEISQVINNFNNSQSEYTAKIKKYDGYDAMMLDVVRGAGPDVLALNAAYLNVLGNKEALEDLNRYFESSEQIKREDLFSAVWNAGTVRGRMVGVMSGFIAQAMLVEKGHTQNGGWTIEDYLSLMDQYPDVPVSEFVSADSCGTWLVNDLSKLSEKFVDLETRTCSFDSEKFISLIKEIRTYAKEATMTHARIHEPRRMAEALYDREVQTLLINFNNRKFFSSYKSLRDTFFENYELAGIPNLSGEPEYMLLSKGVIYSMNADSKKKDAAWQLFECMLSEKNQMKIDAVGNFPARRDVLEQMLQEEMNADPEDTSYRYEDMYTGEKITKRGVFTEADRDHILYILDHTSGVNLLYNNDFNAIFTEEMGIFWAGDKTAEETAKNIQNRVSLFLMEQE